MRELLSRSLHVTLVLKRLGNSYFLGFNQALGSQIWIRRLYHHLPTITNHPSLPLRLNYWGLASAWRWSLSRWIRTRFARESPVTSSVKRIVTSLPFLQMINATILDRSWGTTVLELIRPKCKQPTWSCVHITTSKFPWFWLYLLNLLFVNVKDVPTFMHKTCLLVKERAERWKLMTVISLFIRLTLKYQASQMFFNYTKRMSISARTK